MLVSVCVCFCVLCGASRVLNVGNAFAYMPVGDKICPYRTYKGRKTRYVDALRCAQRRSREREQERAKERDTKHNSDKASAFWERVS